MVPAERIELPTFGLQNRCTTAVLRRHFTRDAAPDTARKLNRPLFQLVNGIDPDDYKSGALPTERQGRAGGVSIIQPAVKRNVERPRGETTHGTLPQADGPVGRSTRALPTPARAC